MADSETMWMTVGIVLLVIIGSVVVVFLGYMVRTAYEMKVELKNQVERGLRAVDEESNKKSRGVRQELIAEIERTRLALSEENRRRIQDIQTAVLSRQTEFESAARQDRVQSSVTQDALRDELVALSQRLEEIERELLTGGTFEDHAGHEDPAMPLAVASGSSVVQGPGGARR